jgi:hypothetical protein
MNIYQKLIEVRKVVPYLQKESTGSQYKYVSSSQVLGNIREKMDELGLLLVPNVTNHKVSESIIEQVNDKGQVLKRTTTYFTELDVLYTWINSEKPDEQIKCEWYGQGVDIAGEKGVGKALTYAEKYFLLKFFNIPTDKDDPDSFQDKYDKDDEPKQESKKPKEPTQSNKPEPTKTTECITESQAKIMFSISKGNIELVKKVLLKYKYINSKDVKKVDYDKICLEIESLASQEPKT